MASLAKLLVPAVLILPQASRAARPGFSVTFLGWRPDSTELAYRKHQIRRRKPARDTYVIKRMKGHTRAAPVRVDGVAGYVVKHRFSSRELRVHKRTAFEHVFALDFDVRLRIAIRVHAKRLSYEVWLDRSGKPSRRMLVGWFKEVWTDIGARVYPSPDRCCVAIVLDLATSYKTDAWVEGLRIRER